MRKLLFIIVAMLFVGITTTQAKEPFKSRMSVGINAMMQGASAIGARTGEPKPSDPALTIASGISFEAQLSRHSGIETGIYHRQLNFSGYSFAPADYTNTGSWSESYIVIPISYKFYSKILNFTAGASIGFNLNYDKAKAGSIQNDFAAMFSISKDITLYEGLYIEPQIQGGLGNRAWWGVGVGVKYRF